MATVGFKGLRKQVMRPEFGRFDNGTSKRIWNGWSQSFWNFGRLFCRAIYSSQVWNERRRFVVFRVCVLWSAIGQWQQNAFILFGLYTSVRQISSPSL